MKEKIKKIVKKSPFLSKCFWLLANALGVRGNNAIKKIKGKGNVIKVDRSVSLVNCTVDIVGNHNRVEIDAASVFNNVTFFIRGNNNKIQIGKAVSFSRGGSIWIEDFECVTEIGERTTFEDVHIAVTEPKSKIIIGKDCMFANDIDIRTGDSHSIIDSGTNERINYAKNVIIGDHVWVAAHVSILKGVHISDNSVIATRAVVTKSFQEKNILIGGVPAKKLKENINWSRERLIASR